MKFNKEDVLSKIELVMDPSRNQTLKDLNAIKHIGINEEDESVVLLIEVGVKTTEVTSQISRSIAKIVKIDMGFKSLVVDYNQARPDSIQKRVKVLGIVSGKGGVGKSSVTANLATALTSLGKKVGVIDADVYGANLPKIFGATEMELLGSEDGKIYPIEVNGIELVSTEYFVDKNKALMWRGPMLNKVLKIFFEDTVWHKDLEFLLIDLPPGTGDVMMDIKTFVPDAKMVLVTTPHENASHIAIKAGFAARDLSQDVIGVIENMSYYEVNNEKHYIFGKNGGSQVADKLLVPLLAEIPIGQPNTGSQTIFDPKEPIGIVYLSLAKKIAQMI